VPAVQAGGLVPMETVSVVATVVPLSVMLEFVGAAPPASLWQHVDREAPEEAIAVVDDA